jgi:hypothetical protein
MMDVWDPPFGVGADTALQRALTLDPYSPEALAELCRGHPAWATVATLTFAFEEAERRLRVRRRLSKEHRWPDPEAISFHNAGQALIAVLLKTGQSQAARHIFKKVRPAVAKHNLPPMIRTLIGLEKGWSGDPGTPPPKNPIFDWDLGEVYRAFHQNREVEARRLLGELFPSLQGLKVAMLVADPVKARGELEDNELFATDAWAECWWVSAPWEHDAPARKWLWKHAAPAFRSESAELIARRSRQGR